ncbi:hypothetical protein R5R35_005580 [Gryllus longicercus]|uniref:Epoxide hydrolase n=1 Tax=Gryllus longicercus TaxID=2509291 RepID=A0AAN9Z014_9ORTH
MGFLKIILGTGAIAALFLAISTGIAWHKFSKPYIPGKYPDQIWGKEKTDNLAIVPFKVNVSNEVLSDLQNRLLKTPQLTPPLEDANFRYGFSSDYLQKVVQFWLKEYKWREREAFLNKFPQFKTQVAGLNIHFIHVKPSKVPEGVRVLPLLLLHGWPGSVREFYDLIPLLTTPRDHEKFVFEVVAPSLPGYGFSDGASKKGLGAAQMAVVLKSLMERIGFKKFYVQGGDWGSIIGSDMSILFPNSVLGYHSNMCFVNSPLATVKQIISSIWPSLFIDEDKISNFRSFGERLMYLLEETGYMHLQSTKPDTIGVALRDSPAGLASYILEKFSTWTDREWRSLADGGLTKKYKLINLLDNIMIYWVTGSITTSLRLYSETFNKAQFSLGIDRAQCTVPTACALFPNEIDYQHEFILKDKYVNLIQVTEMPRGGHFAAFEEPELLADDIWEAVYKMRLPPKGK